MKPTFSFIKGLGDLRGGIEGLHKVHIGFMCRGIRL